MNLRRLVPIPILLVLLSSCASPPDDPARGAAAQKEGRWRKVAEPPLSPRRSAHAAWVAGRLVVMGGTEAEPCPANADCVEPTEPPQRDGAAYDPGSDTWTPIAPAPVPLGFGSRALVDERVYLLIAPYGSSHPSLRRAFVAYDARTDEWTELALPPGSAATLTLTPAGNTVVAYHSSQEFGIEPDVIYDPRTNSWSELPADPLAPSFDRAMVATADGMTLLGIEVVPQPGAEEPALYRAAALRGGKWVRLPDSEVVGSNPTWTLVGDRVVNAAIQSYDGGGVNNWGRSYPAGGILDLSEERWSQLPATPGRPGDFTGIEASGERYIVSHDGWVFDAKAGSWVELIRPDGAPGSEAAPAWTDTGLFVWGGVRWEGSDGVLLNDGFMWEVRPPSG